MSNTVYVMVKRGVDIDSFEKDLIKLVGLARIASKMKTLRIITVDMMDDEMVSKIREMDDVMSVVKPSEFQAI